MISIHPASKYGRTSNRVKSRSPSWSRQLSASLGAAGSVLTAMGIVVLLYKSLSSLICPGRRGSSIKRGRWGSSSCASCLAIPLCTLPWKSLPDQLSVGLVEHLMTYSPTSSPIDLTSASRWTVASRAWGESSHPSYQSVQRP
jgi:hypothetical protein